MSDAPYLQDVRQQYETLPYPVRDPADERRRLLPLFSASLLVINHHCFRGKRDFRNGFRCLIAGGGTGDSTIYLAEQLRSTDAEVVYLDISTASRQVAEARAAVRGLTNIRWVSASILELPRLGLGEFDYIECGGVLHHLESTEAGLDALNSVLREDGAIFLMLYAKYGRQSVYDMQALLRNYLPDGLPITEKIRMTRQLLATLPGSNSFQRNLDTWKQEIDAEGGGDAGLYDLLLHSQDRCFDVPGVYALARHAGLQLLGFAVRPDAYDPANHVTTPGVRKYLATLDKPRRQALAEQLVGNILKHEFFLARQPGRGARLDDDDIALCAYGPLKAKAMELSASMVPSPGRMVAYDDGFNRLSIPCTHVSKLILANLDGSTAIRSLRKHACRTLSGVTPAIFNEELRELFRLFHTRGMVYLIRAGDIGVRVPTYRGPARAG